MHGRMSRHGVSRLGAAVGEFVVVLVAAGTLGGFSIYLVPQMLSAADSREPALLVEPPIDLGHAAVFDGIREIFAGRRAVVRVWEHGGGSVDVLVWLGDAHGQGVIDRDELMLVSFSEVLETVTAYLFEGEVGDGAVDIGAIARGRFPDVWRRSEGVEARLIASGVRVVRFEQAEAGKGMVRLMIALRWGSRGADGTISEARFESLLPAIQGMGAG